MDCSVVACLVFFGGWLAIHPILIYNETWNVMSGVVQKVVSVHRASNFGRIAKGITFKNDIYKLNSISFSYGRISFGNF